MIIRMWQYVDRSVIPRSVEGSLQGHYLGVGLKKSMDSPRIC